MRSKDIEPGVVYAWNEDPAWNKKSDQIVFFEEPSRDTMYTFPRGNRQFRKDMYSTRAKRGAGYFETDIGYIAAVGKDVSGASLDEAFSCGDENYRQVERPYKYRLITALRHVYGPTFEEYEAKLNAEHEAENAKREADRRARNNEIESCRGVVENLSAWVKARTTVNPHTGRYEIVVSLSEARNLVELLEGLDQ